MPIMSVKRMIIPWLVLNKSAHKNIVYREFSVTDTFCFVLFCCSQLQ